MQPTDPPTPQLKQEGPKCPVERTPSGPLSPRLETRELMAQREILGNHVRPVFRDRDDERDDQRQLQRHDDEGSVAHVGNRQLRSLS